jgi:hypothetical protein
VNDARTALQEGDVARVLKWVRKDRENEIRDAFRQTMSVRGKGDDAKVLADRYFFETLVRIHRAGEGEAFTGLKPETSVDPGIELADQALKSGSGSELAEHIADAVGEGVRKRFTIALERSKHATDSVEAGRDYVEAYVDFIHFVERAHQLVSHGVSHLHSESAPHVE